MATSNTILGPVSLAPRGEYDPAAQYTYLDLVRYNGSGYLVLRSIQGVTPVDGADYMLITERGGIGATGATGPQGEQGIQGAQGEKGETGDPGSSIASIERTTGTGAPGTRDTYTITLTDGSTSSFEVYNGADGIGAGDMTAAIYDPQGKAQDIFKYVDDHTQPDAVQAAQVGYDSTESGLEAETVQGALDRLSAIKVDVERVSNPNLLDNWYFADPINQRGQMEYIGAGYTIDRWLSHTTSGEIGVVPLVGIVPHNSSKTFIQYKPQDEFYSFFGGNVMTLSAIYNGKLYTDTGIIPKSFGGTSISYMGIASDGFIAEVRHFDNQNLVQICRLLIPSDKPVYAVKLELGPVQTLAHREGDTWVLNDPPPDPALELAKCQYFQYTPFSNFNGYGDIATGYIWDETSAVFVISCPKMRSTPTLIIENGAKLRISAKTKTGVISIVPEAIGIQNSIGNCIMLRATVASSYGAEPGSACGLWVDQAPGAIPFLFDANL